MARFEDAIGTVLEHEGGLADHPADPGGVTNYGISLRYLQGTGDYGDLDGDGDIDRDDVLAMTPEQAEGFYRRDFWEPLGLELLHAQALATKVLDMAVNMGLRRAAKVLQRGLNLALGRMGLTPAAPWTPRPLIVDGSLGPKTRALANLLTSTDVVAVLDAVREQHAAYYRALVDARPELGVFLGGWLRRAAC